jgi:hypothetical protein
MRLYPNKKEQFMLDGTQALFHLGPLAVGTTVMTTWGGIMLLISLSATSALALLVFFSVHWFGIRIQDLRTYLRHYLSPSPTLLPFHVIGEITLALALRLFGTMGQAISTALESLTRQPEAEKSLTRTAATP